MQALVPMNGPVVSPLRDGLYPGITRPEYERIEAVNYSTLKHFHRTPAHAHEYMVHPKDPTEAMDLGTAGHRAILEPARLASEYAVGPKVDKRTKAGKDAWLAFEDANRGKLFLDEEEMLACRTMTEQVYAHETARQLLSSPGKNEVGVVWTDKPTGLRCKALLDRITVFAGWTVVVDLKTCRDASRWAFANAVARLLYHEQAAFYLQGLDAAASLPRRFLWVAVENERPHCAAVYEPDDGMLREGKLLAREHLESYARCRDRNQWPGYPSAIEEIQLPAWALTKGADAN